MNLLLDTHFLVWLAIAPDRVTVREFELIGVRGNRVLVSAVSIWEIRLKWSRRHRSGDRKMAISPGAALIFAEESNFELVGLSPTHAAATPAHPEPNSDPFDMLLLAQAQELDARLLTRDRDLVGHPLALTA